MIPWAAAHQGLYGNLRLPVTIITGEADEVITATRQSMRLHRDIPHSELRVIPGLGHMLHYFAQDEIAALLEATSRRNGSKRTGEPDEHTDPARHVSEDGLAPQNVVSTPAAY